MKGFVGNYMIIPRRFISYLCIFVYQIRPSSNLIKLSLPSSFLTPSPPSSSSLNRN